jgi:hypothetical protein
VKRGYHGVATDDGLVDASRRSDVTHHEFASGGQGGTTVAGEHPHLLASGEELGNEDGAKVAGATYDEDHGRLSK